MKLIFGLIGAGWYAFTHPNRELVSWGATPSMNITKRQYRKLTYIGKLEVVILQPFYLVVFAYVAKMLIEAGMIFLSGNPPIWGRIYMLVIGAGVYAMMVRLALPGILNLPWSIRHFR